jgi:hypothetical protein
MGSNMETAQAAVTSEHCSHGLSEFMRTSERSIADVTPSAALNDELPIRVPIFDTGEPQYTWGDGGGRPVAGSRFIDAVLKAVREPSCVPVLVRTCLPACAALLHLSQHRPDTHGFVTTVCLRRVPTICRLVPQNV